MRNSLPDRKPRASEIASFQTADGKTVAAIVKNIGGAYLVFISKLTFDDDEEVLYWSDNGRQTGGIYATIEIAKSETELVVGPLFANVSS